MDACSLKLRSRQLTSGKVQVKFTVKGLPQECYGYVLAEPKSSLREVVERIGRHVKAIQQSDRYYQRNLFSFGNRKSFSGKVMIFKQS
ncbi:MAG: hypothetical protein HC811_05130 [Flammeovirgaceae bacterium]|nr:hypothetical protein [Flammeovirgaceae bacterium]